MKVTKLLYKGVFPLVVGRWGGRQALLLAKLPPLAALAAVTCDRQLPLRVEPQHTMASSCSAAITNNPKDKCAATLIAPRPAHDARRGCRADGN